MGDGRRDCHAQSEACVLSFLFLSCLSRETVAAFAGSVLDFVSSNPSELQIGRLFRLLDEDSSGTIDFDEFRHLAQLIHVSMDEGSPSKDPTQLTGVPTLSRLEANL